MPNILDRDTVLVDEGEAGRVLRDGQIYVVRMGDEIFVKRLRKAPWSYIFMSDNPAFSFQYFEVKEENHDEFKAIGRVLWVGRDLG